MTYANYSYNAWGEPVRVYLDNGSEITAADNIANLNPIRYRGYYYDTETGFYYLQSRYYDPVLCRFVNADSQLDSDSFLGYNLFAYCANNPVNNSDPDGHGFWKSVKKAFNKVKKAVKRVGKAVKKIVKKSGKTVGLAFKSFVVETGIGAGLRGGFSFFGQDIGLGANVDVVHLKINSDGINLGGEAQYNLDINTSIFSLGLQGGYFHPFSCNQNNTNPLHDHMICSNTTQYDATLEPGFNIIGADLYLLYGASFNVSFDYKYFLKEAFQIWDEK